MSSTNKTTYYDLPQFVDSDLFNPLVDDNDAYDKIDTALHNIADAEADDASEIVGVKSRVTTAEGKIEALETQNGVEALTTTAQTLSGAVNELDADVASLDDRLDVVEDDINNENTGLKVKVANLTSRMVTAEGDIDALATQNGNNTLITTAQTLSGAVNELATEIPKYLKKSMIGNNITKYLFEGYCIYIVKVEDGAVPKVYGVAKGTHYLQDKAQELNASICLNAGFTHRSGDEAGEPYGVLIADGTVVAENENANSYQYVSFNANGDMKCFESTASASDILGEGYTNSLAGVFSVVKNGAIDTASMEAYRDPTKYLNSAQQQHIACDVDNNYYIITTSYNFPLNEVQLATFLFDEIDNLKNCCALDGGGSVNTVVNGVQLNATCDPVSSKGRPINGLIYFENKSDAKELMNLANSVSYLKSFINPVALIEDYDSNSDPDFDIAGVRLFGFQVYQVGALVVGHGLLTFDENYTNSGQTIDLTGPVLPNCLFDHFYFTPLVKAYSDQQAYSGRIVVANEGTSQVASFNAHLAVRVNQMSSAYPNHLGTYDFAFCYPTNQDKTV